LFITLKTGSIVSVDGSGSSKLFLDLTNLVKSTGSEQGLLGLAFHPRYRKNGFFFVSYTNFEDDLTVVRYRVASNRQIADPASASVVLTLPKTTEKHNGGQIAFGPDGYLYISTGDADIPVPDLAQDLASLFGKILRIDVNSDSPYGVPPDNPLVGVAGAREEIWAWGLRNPWRFGFDRRTGDLFVADVGKNAIEEVNFQPARSNGGENYGWRIMEGSRCAVPPTDCNDGSLTLPILEYEHSEGNCAVTGGYRYRGRLYPELEGIYFYGDFCSGRIWGARRAWPDSWLKIELRDAPFRITTFGEDESGELYVGDFDQGVIYRIVGVVPDIKVNDSDGPLTVSAADPVVVSVSTIPGSRDGKRADWWIGSVLKTADPKVVDTLSAGTARMRTVSNKVVFEGALSPGVYRFGILVDDTPRDGWEGSWSDWVTVEVTPN
jgi:hypothetical protein